MSSGGKRPGAGRKALYKDGYKRQTFFIREDLIDKLPREKSDFVNEAIETKLKAVK